MFKMVSLIVNSDILSSLLVKINSPNTWAWKYFRKNSEMSSRDEKEEYVVMSVNLKMEMTTSRNRSLYQMDIFELYSY
jgi:hypothetical protein